MPKKENNFAVITPDQPTTDYICSRLKSRFKNSITGITAKKNWISTATALLKNSAAPVLLIAPTLKMRSAPAKLVSICIAQKGIPLIWKKKPSDEDMWFLHQLLYHKGAIQTVHLDSLIEIANLFLNTNYKPVTTVSIAKPENELLQRVYRQIPSRFLQKNGQLLLQTGSDGSIHAATSSGTARITCSPGNAADAISMFCTHWTTAVNAEAPEININTEIIEMIARPPARLLSETTSKRLLDAFGMNFPDEKICSSPSSAIRFAKEHKQSIVLKLVRPAFTNKEQQGAVIANLTTQAEIRQAYQTLLELNKTLGPPRALGIMASEFINYRHSFWIELQQKKETGMMLVIGSGTVKATDRLAAIPVDTGFDKILQTLMRICTFMDTGDIKILTMAIFQICTAVVHLAGHLSTLAIHPLVITNNGSALVLDALAGISGSD